MEKTHIYSKRKKVLNFYLTVVVVVTVLLTRQLVISFEGKNIASAFKDTFKKIPIELFVKSSFSLSPNLEYLSGTYIDETTKEMNKFTFFTNHYLPLLSYMVNTQIVTSDSMVEIYPYIDEHKGEYIEDEKFTLDDLHANNSVQAMSYSLEQLSDFNFMLNNLYTVDSNIMAEKNLFDVKYFMEADQSINFKEDGPKILVYHTHSQEAFIDSKPGDKNDTIVGVGDELVRILEEEYKIEVIHLKGEYDVIDGKLDRSQAYQRIEPELKDVLKKNPSIEVLIDVHRDGIPDNLKLVTEINGKPTAKIMFFNGLSRIMMNGKMTSLASMPNTYVKDNMALSFQMHLQANALYPGLTRKIYLKGYRYNLHLMPKSLLVEVGAQTNTVEEAKNAMEPLAEILYHVIQ
ncbi:MAG: stage II sporulation protein P [Firmicutes bacterium HGW-Firmicutes-7]|nr:MAG: stage II sporulation protein P [Firmicutes bacterium HGW-Firmicutes-7]